jgi:hypothetical protein
VFFTGTNWLKLLREIIVVHPENRMMPATTDTACKYKDGNIAVRKERSNSGSSCALIVSICVAWYGSERVKGLKFKN